MTSTRSSRSTTAVIGHPHRTAQSDRSQKSNWASSPGSVWIGTDAAGAARNRGPADRAHGAHDRRIRAREALGADLVVHADRQQPRMRIQQLPDPLLPPPRSSPARRRAPTAALAVGPQRSTWRSSPGDTPSRPRSPCSSNPDDAGPALSRSPPGSTWKRPLRSRRGLSRSTRWRGHPLHGWMVRPGET